MIVDVRLYAVLKEQPSKDIFIRIHFEEGMDDDENISGDDNGEAPPVPIPNTEVKLSSADGTWMEASWESRSLPGGLRSSLDDLFFLFF